MQDPCENFYKTTTLNDVQLAAAYYPILIELAKHKHCLTYGELVEKAKELRPELEHVQNAIPVSTGRKLDVVRKFIRDRELPDVTSLIINKGRGECGTGFTDFFADPEAIREDVYAYDWSEVTTEFDVYIEDVEKQATPRKRRKKQDALKLMSEHFQLNKNAYPSTIKKKRETIIVLLMEGFSAEESFSQVVAGI